MRNWLDLLCFLLSGLPANGTIAAEVAFMFNEWYKPNSCLGERERVFLPQMSSYCVTIQANKVFAFSATIKFVIIMRLQSFRGGAVGPWSTLSSAA